ncbi:MAG: hypothetical protein ACQEQK_01485, partial [Thermodesulfobacteriota bacterium]
MLAYYKSPLLTLLEGRFSTQRGKIHLADKLGNHNSFIHTGNTYAFFIQKGDGCISIAFLYIFRSFYH